MLLKTGDLHQKWKLKMQKCGHKPLTTTTSCSYGCTAQSACHSPRSNVPLRLGNSITKPSSWMTAHSQQVRLQVVKLYRALALLVSSVGKALAFHFCIQGSGFDPLCQHMGHSVLARLDRVVLLSLRYLSGLKFLPLV